MGLTRQIGCTSPVRVTTNGQDLRPSTDKAGDSSPQIIDQRFDFFEFGNDFLISLCYLFVAAFPSPE